jgi:hypothetical protein
MIGILALLGLGYFMLSSKSGGGTTSNAAMKLSGMDIVLKGAQKFSREGKNFVLVPLQVKTLGGAGPKPVGLVDATSYVMSLRNGQRTIWVDPDWRALIVSEGGSPGTPYEVLLKPEDAWPPKG